VIKLFEDGWRVRVSRVKTLTFENKRPLNGMCLYDGDLIEIYIKHIFSPFEFNSFLLHEFIHAANPNYNEGLVCIQEESIMRLHPEMTNNIRRVFNIRSY